ncbi:hypothetical protein LEMLEM_LOCUS5483 [Lemmus lemmus]
MGSASPPHSSSRALQVLHSVHSIPASTRATPIPPAPLSFSTR